MNGGRPAAEGGGGGAEASFEILFEGGQIGADRGEPVCIEGFADVTLFGAAHVGDREEDAFHLEVIPKRVKALSQVHRLRWNARELPSGPLRRRQRRTPHR